MRAKINWILGLTVVLAMAATAEPVVKGVLGKALDAYITAAAREGFSGAVLVSRDGEVALSKGYGLADREAGVPVTENTVFSTGSLTKQFTAAAILALEESGKLTVEDPLSRFFPDAPEDKRDITVHQLLTHTAGMRDIFGRDDAPLTREEFMEKAMKSRLRSAPGEEHAYSNAGYSILGVIIEHVSGMSYEAYLHECFFGPLEMNATGYQIPKYAEGQEAIGYRGRKRWGKLRDKNWTTDGPYWNLRANGGILSTVEDMHRWHEALASGEALSEASLKKMFTRHVPENEKGFHYGYGWSIFTTSSRDTTVQWHDGSNGMFFAVCFRYIDEGVFIVSMTNDYSRDPGVARKVRQIVFDQS